MAEVPYRSAPQMVQDVASGVLQVIASSIAVTNAVTQAGKLRRLALTSGRRFPGMDLPIIAETLPGFVIDGFFAVVAPTGTPAEIVQRVNRETEEFLKGEAIRARLLTFGLATEGAGTPESTAQYIREEQDRWRKLAVELDILPQ
jgi:tripartite-type tricarboxylate transporter receptor subunit TctC